VMQPSWDGDSFLALKQYGAQLLALKKNRIWRVLGTYPGEFTLKEQYGGGVAAPATLGLNASALYMLGIDGVTVYDGADAVVFQKDAYRNLFARFNSGAIDEACACIYKAKYYLALALDGSQTNNAVLVYDTNENTWGFWQGVSVESFLPTDKHLYFTSAGTPGAVYRWAEGERAMPLEWVTPWQTFGRMDAVKEAFTIRYVIDAEDDVGMWLEMETDRGNWIRKYTRKAANPGTSTARMDAVTFTSAKGRRWRLRVKSLGGAMWTMPGGMQVQCDVNAD